MSLMLIDLKSFPSLSKVHSTQDLRFHFDFANRSRPVSYSLFCCFTTDWRKQMSYVLANAFRLSKEISFARTSLTFLCCKFLVGSLSSR